jgi:hypothetical protein
MRLFVFFFAEHNWILTIWLHIMIFEMGFTLRIVFVTS